MFILNKKNGVITECNNEDVIEHCKKHSDEYAVGKKPEELKGNANIVGYEDHLVERSDDGMSFTIMIKMELLIPLKNHLCHNRRGRDVHRRPGVL